MFAKNRPLALDAGKANMIYKNLKSIYFFILGVAFAIPFLCYFQKFQLPVRKKILK